MGYLELQTTDRLGIFPDATGSCDSVGHTEVHCIFVPLTNIHTVFITKQITFIGYRKLSKSDRALRCTEVWARRGNPTLSNLLLTWQHPVPRCPFQSSITTPNVRACESVLVRFAFSSVIRLSVFHPAASL